MHDASDVSVCAAAVAGDDHSADLGRLARDAFVWGLPLVLMCRLLDISVKAGMDCNRLFLTAELAIPKFRQIGPNIDSLMGHAWLDLSDGPQVIGVPESNDRYYSIQLQDMYMNSFAYIGRRTSGTAAGAYAITPPGYDGALPPGVTEIKATTISVFAYLRTMLIDEADHAAALAVHTGFTLGSLSDHPAGRRPIIRSDRAGFFPHIDFTSAGADFFDELAHRVAVYPPLGSDAEHLDRFAALGIGTTATVPRDAALLAAAIPPAYAEVKRSLHLTWVNGWARRDNVPNFIHDPLQRAANNFFGKGTHVSDEAVYWGTYQGGMGDWLSGANRYRLHFPPGQTPPADAFWSLTLYDDAYVLFDNALGRYGILDRTPGLCFNADGSLDIQIQADAPDGSVSNWLPAPRGGFQLMVRAYQPRQSVLDCSYTPPALEIVGPA